MRPAVRAPVRVRVPQGGQVSIIRVCDCGCHDDYCYECSGPGPQEIHDDEAWQQVGEFDICESCLKGEWCKQWQVFTPRDDVPKPAQLTVAMPAYDKLIEWNMKQVLAGMERLRQPMVTYRSTVNPEVFKTVFRPETRPK